MTMPSSHATGRITVRSLCLIAVVSAATLLAACGGSEPSSKSTSRPEGAVKQPSTNEGQTPSKAPGYQALVAGQKGHARSTFTPCNLVTQKQAAAIVGGPMRAPVEAPQGPTCIYRSQDGNRFITVALQNVEFGKIKRQIQRPSRVTVSSRTAYCGSYGQPMLYIPLAKGQVLSIAGPCAVAKKFAVKALPQLPD
jgi:Protein of unknown function (DUF3558)